MNPDNSRAISHVDQDAGPVTHADLDKLITNLGAARTTGPEPTVPEQKPVPSALCPICEREVAAASPTQQPWTALYAHANVVHHVVHHVDVGGDAARPWPAHASRHMPTCSPSSNTTGSPVASTAGPDPDDTTAQPATSGAPHAYAASAK